MKVLLATIINPNYRYFDMPDLGIGYLASVIRKKHKVYFFNGIKNNNFKKFESYLKKKKTDVVGFKAFLMDVPNLKKSIKIIRNFNPKITIVVGGVYPSSVKEDIFKQVDIDYSICGEGEIGFPLLLDYLEKKKKKSLKKIPGLVWKENGKININPISFINNLDNLDFPAWDLISSHSYSLDQWGYPTKSSRNVPLITTRGCPYNCVYCGVATLMGRRIRKRSINNIIKEIKFLKENYNIKEICMVDDNFTFDKNFVKEFCDKVKDLNIYWTCAQGVRLDSLDEETLILMKESGCYWFGVGIESGSQRILNKMRKHLNLDTIKEKVKLVKKCGINISGFFMIGYPTETLAEIKKTIKLALLLPLDRAYFNILSPVPGTEVYNELKEKGMISNIDFSSYNYNTITVPNENVSNKKLKRIQNLAYLRFYLRPRVMFSILSGLTSPKKIYMMLKKVKVGFFS